MKTKKIVKLVGRTLTDGKRAASKRASIEVCWPHNERKKSTMWQPTCWPAPGAKVPLDAQRLLHR